jgi:hypothetical protein
MRLFLAGILLVGAAPAQSEADKLEAALKKFGERTYSIKEAGQSTGTMTLKTRIEAGDDGKVAVFEDQIAAKTGDTETSVAISERASLNGLALIRGARNGKDSEGKFDWTGRIQDDDALLNVHGQMLVLRDAKGALGEQAVMRLVCAKEQKVGAEFKCKVLLLAPACVDEPHEFRCVAKETLEIGGAKREAFKWQQKWEGEAILKGESIKAKVDNSYWVGPDGTLLQFTSGRKTLTLDAK